MRLPFKLIPVAFLVLGCHAPVAFAQSTPGMAERLHENAVASFRHARFAKACGRFVALADAACLGCLSRATTGCASAA